MKISKIFTAITFALSSMAFTCQAELADNSQDWQTFETENFRVHFTPEYRQWALSSAREMEVVRQLIKDQQGRVLTEKVDTFIIDPYNAANGFAVPLSHKPYMALFTTPAQSDTVISSSTGWQQLLVLHEYVHLVHLAQKSRSNWRNNVANWYDLYDASQINGERWVSEGYATLLESRLTGRGRLFNNQIEAIIQKFARQGAMPSYKELSVANDNFMSGSMAYLVGVRYLKWLEDNYGVDTLDAVWTRWSGLEQRDFEVAFKGVFPDTAKNLYQRFVAEYTFDAMRHELKLGENSNTDNRSALWLDLSDYISGPSLSPQGDYLAIVETQRTDDGKTTKLNVYKTSENTKKAEEFTKENKDILDADPKDIVDKDPSVFKREVAYTLNQKNNSGINNPRWLDKDTIIYGATTLASINSRHQDLFSWHLPTNTVKQLTKSANIRRFDISNNGQYIIAERNRFGYSQLVKVSLSSSSICKITEELSQNSLEHVYDFPRFRPTSDGKPSNSFAYVSSSLNNKWQLKVRQLNGEQETIIPLPENYQFLSFPEWSKDGETLYFVAGLDSATRIYKYDFSTKELSAITSGEQVVTWPMAQADNKLLHLAINPEGSDVFQLDLAKANKQLITDTTTSSAMTVELADKLKLARATVDIDESIGEQSTYGIGPQQGTITLAESYYSASSSIFEVGYKSGDVLSRFDWQVNVSQDVFNNIISGASAAVRWQGWPVKLLAHSYLFNLKTDQQDSDALALGKTTEKGLFLEARYPYLSESLSVDIFAQAQVSQFDDSQNVSFSSQSFSIGVDQHWSYDQQNWGVSQEVSAQLISAKDDLAKINGNDGSYTGSNGFINISAHIKNYALGVNYLWAQRSEDANDILSLGGYTSTLIQEKAHLNKKLAPELAFYRQTGNDYQAIQAYIPLGLVNIFYTRHKMTEQAIIDSYGVKGTLNNDFGFTGVTNLAINYGIAQVNPENKKSDTQGWVGLSYKW
jgi:Tol biopolymer transport system component